MLTSDFAPFMREAVALARCGCWKTYPNPTVGAVLVHNGQIVARGFHCTPGDDHAEIACLKDAAAHQVNPADCTLVVTLEPCCHHGKTPPCTDAILEAGITRVVIGVADPTPVAGGGANILRAAGVEVLEGICEQECRDLIADFLILQNTSRPYVLLKMAATLDGRIATREGHSRWISSEESRREVEELRARVGACGGAVLVGGGTFRTDNPRLSARGPYSDGPQPLACVLTSRLPAPDADMHLLKERPEQTVFLVSPAVAASTGAVALRAKGVRVPALGPAPGGGPDFDDLMRIIRHDLKCPYVLCEGGGRLALALLEAGLVDEFYLHLSPQVLGDNEARPLFTGRTPLSMDEALPLRVCHTHMCGSDIHICLRPV